MRRGNDRGRWKERRGRGAAAEGGLEAEDGTEGAEDGTEPRRRRLGPGGGRLSYHPHTRPGSGRLRVREGRLCSC